MIEQIMRLGQSGAGFIHNLGAAGNFVMRAIIRWPERIWHELLRQLYAVGFMSLAIIVVAGLFIGMVVGLQGYHTLEKFGAASQLGQLLALSVTRELGPVLSALLFAGRAGSALTAEIGLMKTTEQIASMDMMGIDPLGKIIWPRFMAGVIALPLLSLIFSMVAIYGGYLAGVVFLGLDAGTFWVNMQASVSLRLDIIGGMIKSLVFAFVVVWIAVYQGYVAVPTAEGMGEATTRGVVHASLAVLGLDLLLTALMIGGW